MQDLDKLTVHFEEKKRHVIAEKKDKKVVFFTLTVHVELASTSENPSTKQALRI